MLAATVREFFVEERRYDATSARELLEACGDFFAAMGDPVRRNLFITMIESGRTGVDVSMLTRTTNLSRPAVSHHLKLLRNCGLIKARREGTHNYYYVDLQEDLNRVKLFIASAERIIGLSEAGRPD